MKTDRFQAKFYLQNDLYHIKRVIIVFAHIKRVPKEELKKIINLSFSLQSCKAIEHNVWMEMLMIYAIVFETTTRNASWIYIYIYLQRKCDIHDRKSYS